jgi:site-specific DNA-methyltransferase (adenine-specific)
MKDFINKVIQGDCLEVMKDIPDKSIDMILCDLPYGTTACKWDTIIPFEPLWEQYKRIIKDNGSIVLTASQPFTSALVMSNIKMFKYEWVWVKNRITGFANAKKQPLRNYEDVLVFSKAKTNYYPQGLTRINKINKNGKSVGGETLRNSIADSANKGSLRTAGKEYIQEFTGYPKQTLFNVIEDKTKLHPTQKPVALFEYLIKTYTNEGDLVLDNCAGSGTTGVACKNTGRNYILIEKEPEYIDIINKRLITPTI